jgi:CheY-like chemotaxis protein
MPRIIWLDDEPGYVRESIACLRMAGHSVDVATSDEELIHILENGYVPDVVVQDLFRPDSDNILRTYADWDSLLGLGLYERGWRLYDRVLKAKYPQVGVLICSQVADEIYHRKKADDFNLSLLHKHGLEKVICEAVEQIVLSQNSVISASRQPPAVVAVDFNRVSAWLIKHLAEHPADIHSVNWATFEELVSRLLRELGYEVFRTPLTRDGGVDIWAIGRSDLGESLYAIDAKKYAPDRLVGPAPVRAIHGVADMTGSSVGMIVTTSYFSPGAIALAEQYRYKLSLQDFDRVSSWIKKVSVGEGPDRKSPIHGLNRTDTARSRGPAS